MNELIRYEEEIVNLLTTLPVPDEELAWLDMKRRLDEKDDDGIIIPFRKGCGLIALVLIVLAGIGWWWLNPVKWFRQKKEINNNDTIIRRDQTDTLKDQKIYNYANDTNKTTRHASSDTTQLSIDRAISSQEKKKAAPGKINANVIEEERTSLSETKNQSFSVKRNVRKQPYKKSSGGKKTIHTDHQNSNIPHAEIINQHSFTNTQPIRKTDEHNDSNNLFSTPVLPTTDSSTKKKNPQTDSLKRDSTHLQAKKESSKVVEKKSFSFAAGITLQQQIPLSGQSAVPYNYYGRKGTIADYIPSIYLRLYRDKKWFLQSEFRYGAPEYVKQFAYSTKSIPDSSGGSSLIQSLNLKKTYYHQLPLSFNYYVMPGWSAGTGIMWSKFYGAITDDEIILRNNISQTDSILSKKVVRVKSNIDSFFTKSQISWLIESQYKWKHFSFGMRYTLGLVPYIKYTDPAGLPKQEKNHSLQFFIRYEVWKSKPIKKGNEKN